MLLGLGLFGIAAAIYSLSVGTGGPQPQAIGGVNDVQRIFGGIAQDGAYIGPEDATTTITVFNDVQCAPCADFEINTIDPLVEKYARTGDARLEFRHFSLAPNDTTLAAIAAEAAGKQSRQWQYLDTFVRNIEVTKTRAIDEIFLREVAEAVPELDPEQWAEDYNDPSHRGAGPPGRDARRGSEAARRAGGGRLRARRPAPADRDPDARTRSRRRSIRSRDPEPTRSRQRRWKRWVTTSSPISTAAPSHSTGSVGESVSSWLPR